MKKLLLTFAAFALTCTTAFSQTTVGDEASGNYSGPLAIGLGDMEAMETVGATDEDGNVLYDEDGNTIPATYKVTITPDTENTVTFCLPGFGFSGIDLGDITLKNVPVEKQADGTILFGENEAQNFNFLDGMILATAKINEKTSYIKGDSVVVSVDVIWTNASEEADPDDDSDDVPIYVLFKGSDPVKVGIHNATTTTKNADKRVYDLQGRRLNAILKRGISIVNGQKVMK